MKINNTAQIRVRYAETDKMGVVYNGHYLTYFEVGRNEIMRKADISYTKLEDDGYQLPLIESHVIYKNPAFYDDILNVETELIYQNGAVLLFNYNIVSNNKLIATGFTKHVFININTKSTVRPPKLFVEKMNEATCIQN